MEYMLKSTKSLKITFAIIYVLVMSARAIFNPFITVYMQEKGISAGGIGMLMAINSFVIILSQPFWGIVADKLQSVKRTLVICIFFHGVFAFGLIYSNVFVVIGLLFCLYTFFSAPEGPMLDAWSLKTLKNAGDEKSVGHAKLWGCLGYSICVIISGLYINKYSTKAAIPIFSVVLLLIAFIVRNIRVDTVVGKALSIKEMQLGRIMKDYKFLIFLAYIFLMQLPHRAAYTFYPLLITQLGGSKSMVGFTSAVMFISEAALLFASKKLLTKVKAEYLVVASSGFFMLWLFLYSVISSPEQVVWIALLDGPSFALFTIGTLYYLDFLSPKEIRTTYQTISYAVYFGLSGIVGNALGGWCIQVKGFKFMYQTGIVIIFIASVAFYLIVKNYGKRSVKNASIGNM